ncbi:transporter substrate-binding domain-containing protein [Legionella waltersii]|uniref:Arginine transport system periplasmic binding protein n=1 Tax=Legionella waltersii TaxID=66969 RepID=A0A0W1ANN8_9GAMM|nr:transporter substrate-binding domain-containing protein [Legionella waltersii]KTD82943.1 arginine transport system periplasmic binding protein [Legionella waltersii]SNU97421.1 arginine transport system substrate-binding protein [Legionella waltersii]
MKLVRILLSVCLLILPFYQVYARILNIGALSYNPPFEVLSNDKSGRFFGFEISILQEVCKRINAECRFQSMLFDKIPQHLNSGEIDLAIGAIVITPERSLNFQFSLPIKESHLRFLIRSNAPFSEIRDLTHKRIAYYKNSPSKELAMKVLNKKTQLISFSNSMDMLNALEKKEVDAVLTNDSQATYWIANGSKTLKTLGKKFKIGEGYGIMAKLGRTDLISQINKALLDMENDGTYLAIYKKSF